MSFADQPLVDRARYYATRARAWGRRANATALAVRGIVWSSGAAALLMAAWPTLNPSGVALLAIVVASISTSWPDSFLVATLAVLTVVALAIAAGQGAASLPQVGVVAALLYLHHTMAALAAQVRTDALLPAAVLRRWLIRAGGVLALSAVVGGTVVVAPAVDLELAASAYLVAGALAAVGVAAALAYLLLRRPASA